MEITIMNQRVFHIMVSVIFVFCVMYGPEIYANPAAKDSIPVECGKEVFKGSSLDNLANELSKIVRLKRIQESIGIRVPRQKIFGNSPNTLSHDGKQFLAHLAGDLSCYPETMIYIEENSGPSSAATYQAEVQAFRVQTAFREDGIDINRLAIDLTAPPDRHLSAKTGDQQNSPASFVELKIIPRV